MITGSTDGIGRVTALQLAKYGFNLVLVSRSAEKLQKVREECQYINPKVLIEVIPFDFSKDTQYGKVFDGFEKSPNKDGRRLRMLINNVGVIDFKKFFDLSPQEI